MTSAPGRLILVPNTLDFGCPPAEQTSIDEVLPVGVLRIAASLGEWVAENARTTRAFLKRVDAIVALARPLQDISIVELPRPQKGRPHIEAAPMSNLLKPASAGADIGLISEAGLPAVADPGAGVVQAAHEMGIEVVALPGPSSLLLALAAGGLNGQSFAFLGYLPVEASARAARIRDLESTSRQRAQTQLVIETPYRNEALMNALLAQLQSTTRVSVSCGLTLRNAFSRTATVGQWRASPPRLPADVPAVFSVLAAASR